MTAQQRPRKPDKPTGSKGGSPNLQQYAKEMLAMLRQRDPASYRAFLRKWSNVHEGDVADRLAKLDDAALRLRMERMILDTPALADLHDAARDYVAKHAPTKGLQ